LVGDMRVVPIAHLGELHGLLAVYRRPGDGAYTDQDERALIDLARQLGLAMHNVRLDSALQESLAQLERRNRELEASRLRIVTAADSSRREIERNLHDGAQQHLVALAVQLGLAESSARDRDDTELATLLGHLQDEVHVTIGELRELAHGIYPPLLRDRGLAEALTAAGRRSRLPTTVEAATSRRYPEQVEAAAYFCCLEAMQNAAKHAGGAANVTVHVTGDDHRLCIEVVDDGAGFDRAVTPEGAGFMNMRDRLGAVGAELHVESQPGAGTRVFTTITIHVGIS
jgi:signal transduction histidine kinase